MLSLKWLRRFPFEKYARVFRRCDNAREDLLVHCNYAICLPSHFISKNRCCHQDAITLCCWNCGATIQNQEQSICKTCTTDYFKFLNLKRDFNIDLNSLKNAFRKKQFMHHPDRFANKDVNEKAVSAYYSSLLNQAFTTLQSDLSRGLYLLELEGYPLLEGDLTLEQDFISEIIELNEEMDALGSLKDLHDLKKSNIREIENILKLVAEEFRKKDWKEAQKYMGKLKFYYNIKEKIKQLELDWQQSENK